MSLYISFDAYSGKSMISSRPRSQVPVAVVSPPKMAGPTVKAKGVVDRLNQGKCGDYESCVLDPAKKNPH